WSGSFADPNYAAESAYDIYGGWGGRYGYSHTATRRPIGGEGSNQANAAAASASTNTALAETRTGLAPGVTNLPIGNIERTVAPAGEQAVALERLKSALSTANEIIQASCPSEAPLTPVKRLDAVEGRLNAMLQAVQLVGG